MPGPTRIFWANLTPFSLQFGLPVGAAPDDRRGSPSTADVCQLHVKPATVPAGWADEVAFVDPAQREFVGQLKHSYVQPATGRRQSAPPLGTQSYCDLLAAGAQTRRFV
jgi:hypothetical protein